MPPELPRPWKERLVRVWTRHKSESTIFFVVGLLAERFIGLSSLIF